MSDQDSDGDDVASHVAALKRLKKSDPEFYDFLQENDKKLLNFKDSDSENDDLSTEDEGEDKVEEDDTPSKRITSTNYAYIKEQIKSSPTVDICKQVVAAFKTVVRQVDGVDNKADMSNSELFNNVIKLCLVELVPALYNVLKLSPEKNKQKIDPSKSKIWHKMKMIVKSYLIDMLKMLTVLKESSLLVLLLKHVVHLIPFYLKFAKLSRLLLKEMVKLWCSEEETVRVLSLIIIVRVSKHLPRDHLEQVLKRMYFAYVQNTKFTSKSTWPMINFMKRSLTEVYILNPEIAYGHAFVYIRQLAIHLRNAVTTKKKEAYQTVYNWQYIHCLLLWAHLLCQLCSNDALKTLIYPLVQTMVGTINLVPTAKFVPLRIHLIKAFIYMSQETDIFIPVLPFILDILSITKYNKNSSFSVKPLDFSCSLKVTKSQLVEAGFKDGCIAEVCDLLLDYCKIFSHSIGFPELALPAVLQIKNFIKQCKISKYNQQLKALLLKIEENSLFVSEKRRSVNFKITENEEINKWEEHLQALGTPLLQFRKEMKEADELVSPRKKQKVHD